MAANTDKRVSFKSHEVDRLLELLARDKKDSINKSLVQKMQKLAIRQVINGSAGKQGSLEDFSSIFEGAARLEGVKQQDSLDTQPHPSHPHFTVDEVLQAALRGEASQKAKDWYFDATGFRL